MGFMDLLADISKNDYKHVGYYADMIKKLNPPFKCTYKGEDYIAVDKTEKKWVLRPCHKSTNKCKDKIVSIDSYLEGIYYFLISKDDV